jgi:hypothetical protein
LKCTSHSSSHQRGKTTARPSSTREINEKQERNVERGKRVKKREKERGKEKKEKRKKVMDEKDCQS